MRYAVIAVLVVFMRVDLMMAAPSMVIRQVIWDIRDIFTGLPGRDIPKAAMHAAMLHDLEKEPYHSQFLVSGVCDAG